MAQGQDIKSSIKFQTDVLVEILSHLPLKSYYRFKTVSKFWFDLSSDPYIRKKLPQFSTSLVSEQSNFGIHYRSKLIETSISNGGLTFDTIDFSRVQNERFHDCCNGLLLCSYRSTLDKDHTLYVSNPAISKKYTIIHEPKHGFIHRRIFLAFDPNVSLHFNVLSFEVVGFNDGVKNLKIFSSKTRQWKPSEINWATIFQLHSTKNSHVFLNEMLHLLCNEKILVVHQEGTSYETVPLPERLTSRFSRLAKCENKLLCITHNSIPNEIKIWVLEDYVNKKWILKHHINITTLLGRDSWYFHYGMMAFDQVRNVIYNFVAYEEGDNKIVSYNFNNGETEIVSTLGEKQIYNSFYFEPCYADCFGVGILVD